MKTYRLQFNKNNVIILTLVAVPLIGMAALFVLLFSLPTTTPDWIIITIISIFLVLMSGLVVFIAVRYLTIPCRLTLEESGLHYEFERKSLFYRRNSFFSGWENVTNISENFNNGQGSFYRISF